MWQRFLHIFVAYQLNNFKEHIPTPLGITYFHYGPLNDIQPQSNQPLRLRMLLID